MVRENFLKVSLTYAEGQCKKNKILLIMAFNIEKVLMGSFRLAAGLCPGQFKSNQTSIGIG